MCTYFWKKVKLFTENFEIPNMVMNRKANKNFTQIRAELLFIESCNFRNPLESILIKFRDLMSKMLLLLADNSICEMK